VLVVEAHQAFVASRLAVGLEVDALVVEMALVQCLAGQSGGGIGLFQDWSRMKAYFFPSFRQPFRSTGARE